MAGSGKVVSTVQLFGRVSLTNSHHGVVVYDANRHSTSCRRHGKGRVGAYTQSVCTVGQGGLFVIAEAIEHGSASVAAVL